MVIPSHPQVLDQILEGLMSRYRERVPEVGRVMQGMIDSGIIPSMTAIENDHIAFRTLGIPPLGIQSLERIFLRHGYQRRDAYYFASKKLDAFWYAPPLDRHPRVFISQLRVGDLSARLKALLPNTQVRSRTTQRCNLI